VAQATAAVTRSVAQLRMIPLTTNETTVRQENKQEKNAVASTEGPFGKFISLAQHD
jgi:hypothetical protein